MNKCIGRRRRRFLSEGLVSFPFLFFWNARSGRGTVPFYSIELNSPSMVSSLETFVVRTKPILYRLFRLLLVVVAPRVLCSFASRLVCIRRSRLHKD